MGSLENLSCLRLELRDGQAWLWLSRPEKANAMYFSFWDELALVLDHVRARAELRVLIIAAEGKHFSAGAELDLLEDLVGQGRAPGCPAAARDALRKTIIRLQDGFTALEALSIPVIAAVHGACFGSALELIAACDLRYATKDARFCLKEVDYAVVADVGGLQRLRHIIGLAALTEMALLGCEINGETALRRGLVNALFESRDALLEGVAEMARVIAAKPALTVAGIKNNLLYTRDHTVAEGLERVASWNASALPSDDSLQAISSQRERLKAASRRS